VCPSAYPYAFDHGGKCCSRVTSIDSGDCSGDIQICQPEPSICTDGSKFTGNRRLVEIQKKTLNRAEVAKNWKKVKDCKIIKFTWLSNY